MLKLKHNNCMTVTGDSGTITHPGTCITKDTILAKCDEMQTAIRDQESRAGGQGFQSQLDPPPGPPVDERGNFILPTEWTTPNWPSHIHSPREHQSGGGA